MGWSSSLWFLPGVPPGARRRGVDPLEVRRTQPLHDRGGAPTLTRRVLVLALHVDKANLTASDEKDLKSVLTALKAQFNSASLMFREECPGERQVERLGLLLDGPSLEIRVKTQRPWRLRFALRQR